MTPEELLIKLSAPFSCTAVEWRLQWADESKGGWAVPYLTNRAIQQRLDDTVGVGQWKNEYLPWHDAKGGHGAQLCGISIYFEDRNEWVTKYDGADNSEIEPVKGGLSDSMKRAAVQWAIGRYLYGMPEQWVDVERKGKSLVVAAKDFSKLNKAHDDYVAKLTAKKQNPPQLPAPQKAETPTGKNAPEPMKSQQSPEQQDSTRKRYHVLGVVRQPSMSGGHNLYVKLKNENNRIIDVFALAVHPGLVEGATLTDVKIQQQTTQGVVTYTMLQYSVMPPEQNAA